MMEMFWIFIICHDDQDLWAMQSEPELAEVTHSIRNMRRSDVRLTRTVEESDIACPSKTTSRHGLTDCVLMSWSATSASRCASTHACDEASSMLAPVIIHGCRFKERCAIAAATTAAAAVLLLLLLLPPCCSWCHYSCRSCHRCWAACGGFHQGITIKPCSSVIGGRSWIS